MYKCPICANIAIRDYYLVFTHNEAEYSLCRCNDCSHLFYVNFIESDSNKANSNLHATRVYIEKTADFEAIISVLNGFLKSFPQMQNGVEIGCGIGIGIDFVKFKYGVSIRGFEPVAEYFDNAGKYLDLDICQEYFSVSLLTSQPVDFVTCFQVLQLVADPRKLLLDLRTIVARDGMVLISTPNNSSHVSGEFRIENISTFSPGIHRHIFSVDSLTKLLVSAGFSEVRCFLKNGDIYAVASSMPVPNFELFVYDRPLCVDYYTSRISLLSKDSTLYRGFWYRLYRTRLDAGEYEEALQMLESALWFDVWTSEEIQSIGTVDRLLELNTAADAIIYYYTGILLLNKLNKPAYAERFFELSFLLCERIIELQPEMSLVERDIIWLAKLHRILSLYYVGDQRSANLEIQIFLGRAVDQPTKLPTPGESVLMKAREIYKMYYKNSN